MHEEISSTKVPKLAMNNALVLASRRSQRRSGQGQEARRKGPRGDGTVDQAPTRRRNPAA